VYWRRIWRTTTPQRLLKRPNQTRITRADASSDRKAISLGRGKSPAGQPDPGDGVAAEVGTTDAKVGEGVSDGVGVGSGVGDNVAVGEGVGVDVLVGGDVGVAVGVSVGASVGLGVSVGLGDGVTVAVGGTTWVDVTTAVGVSAGPLVAAGCGASDAAPSTSRYVGPPMMQPRYSSAQRAPGSVRLYCPPCASIVCSAPL
jgi:hypothetical protein